MTLQEVKNAIRVDYDDDDALIRMMMESAREYIDDAVDGGYDDSSARHRMLFISIVNSLYENREYSVQRNEKVARMIRSMVSQLQNGW